MTSNKFMGVSEEINDLAIKAQQIHALARVIEDASEKPDRDDRSIHASLQLLSSMLGEDYESVLERYMSLQSFMDHIGK